MSLSYRTLPALIHFPLPCSPAPHAFCSYFGCCGSQQAGSRLYHHGRIQAENIVEHIFGGVCTFFSNGVSKQKKKKPTWIARSRVHVVKIFKKKKKNTTKTIVPLLLVNVQSMTMHADVEFLCLCAQVSAYCTYEVRSRIFF